MRAFLWIVLLLLGLTAVVAPLVYLYTSRQLPPLESELELQTLLRLKIEGERMRVKSSQFGDEGPKVEFTRPDLARLPKDLVGLYLTQHGCPTFFQSPREEGARWAWRLFVGLGEVEPLGDGWCERLFAMRLASRIDAGDMLRCTVGANKIHGFLKKDQLVAYELATLRFDDGLIGVEDLSERLFKKRLELLNLAELAELMLALPPHGYYEQLLVCRNPTLIRQNRDHLLKALGEYSLAPMDRVKGAMALPLACTKP